MADRRSPLWREPMFFRFWAGRSASFFGTELAHFVVPVTAATALQANPAQMGLLAAAQTVPHVLFGLIAGAWADRWPRGRLLVVADLGCGLSLAVTPFAAAAGVLTIERLYALVFVLGTLNVFSNVGYQALLSAVANRSRLVSANAYFEAGGALAEAAGPALGGVLLQASSWGGAYLTGALSFLLGSASALGLPRSNATGEREPRRPLTAEIVDGLRFVVGHPGLRWVVLCGCVDNLIGVGVFGPLYVLYATRTLGVQPAALGAVFAVAGIGALVGALATGTLTDRFGPRATLVAAQLGTGLGRVALATVTREGPVLATLFGAEFLVGVTMPLFNVNLMSLRQAVTDDRLQGRVNATVGMLLWVAAPAGGLAGGAIVETVGVRPALVAAAAMTCLITAVLLLPARDTLEMHMPTA